MYYFPNFDKTTRLLMVSELERDISIGLFYEPVSMQKAFISTYKRILKATFENGTVETLQNRFSKNFFIEKNKNGKKIPSNIREMVAFSDFNRYYIRAILVRAIDENKPVTVYRAKQSVNERQESGAALMKTYFDKITLQRMLYVIRDYRLLFSANSGIPFLKPNSGLSLKLG